MNRPATVIAVLVVVLLHALLLVGGTVASGLALATFTLTHPGLGWSPSQLVPSALGGLLNLLLAAADVVLGLRVWKGARRGRVLLSVCLGVSALISGGGAVATFVGGGTPSVPFTTLWVLEAVVSVAALVLLWLVPTTAWVRRVSVRPAGPGL
jgi:hypothetical protein